MNLICSQIKNNFICLNCQGSLITKKGELICNNCFMHWPIKNRIPIFSKNNEIYWNEISKPEANFLLRLAESQGWQKALYNYLKLKTVKDYLKIGDLRRTDWIHLFPLEKDSFSLNFGCEFGNVGIALSRICQRVYVVDPTWEKVAFLEIRKRQQKIKNLFLLQGGDQLKFPFPPNYFDLIVLTGGTLEETGKWTSKKGKIKKLQKELLENLYLLLKKGGYLYLEVENRFSYQNLFSASYRCSFFGYKNLLLKTGFSKINIYSPLPNFKLPLFYLPLDNPSALDHFFKNISSLFDVVSPEAKREFSFQYKLAKICLKLFPNFLLIKFAKLFTPNFGIIAKK